MSIEQLMQCIDIMAVAMNAVWGTWSVMQFLHSEIDFDYRAYCQLRLNLAAHVRSIAGAPAAPSSHP
eukprot:EC796553.1.p2 GENE.EC796553.1~~EC796553.1.p2  ORF type:complete len:67 (+),score=17.95 EC796553.1:421-621(+)